MKKGLLKKILKVLGVLIFLVLAASAILFHQFTSARSDSEILEEFAEDGLDPVIMHDSFKGIDVRLLQMKRAMDPNLPVLLFVHGSPGSMMDFKRYLKDVELNSMANILTYERVGYGKDRRGKVLSSIAEEIELLHYLVRDLQLKNLVLVGYSYGGTIALASTGDFKKKFALAAAVRGDLEPMFWALNLYKWKWSRPIVPKIFRGAAEEKFRHLHELPAYDSIWPVSPAPVVAIHGKKDRIVPYENSLYLEQLFDNEKFRLMSLEDGGHALIWTDFDEIKSELIKCLELE